MPEKTKRKKRGEITHTIRTASGGTRAIPAYQRNKAIKLFCTECLGYSANPKTVCTSELCPLFPFRGWARAGYIKEDGKDA